MTQKTTMKITVLFGLIILHSLALAEEPQIKTAKDTVNYAIGVNIIGTIKQQGVEIDLDLVMKGMKDAYSGDKLLLTDEELHKGIDRYMTAVRQKRAQIMAKAAEDNQKAGETFLAENAGKEGVVTLPSGLQYKIIKTGTGKKPGDYDTVECHYRGVLANGNEFESSYRTGKPATFKVNTAIPGWREALKLMPAGSQWEIVLPPKLAYGDRGKGSVGPNTAVIFDVEFLSIK